MCELGVAEHAFGNSDVISAKKGLVAGATGSLGTGINGAANWFAGGCIEGIKTDCTCHVME
jgi:hypothetical protein